MATKKQASKKATTGTANKQSSNSGKSAGTSQAPSNGKEMTTEELTLRSFRIAYENHHRRKAS